MADLPPGFSLLQVLRKVLGLWLYKAHDGQGQTVLLALNREPSAADREHFASHKARVQSLDHPQLAPVVALTDWNGQLSLASQWGPGSALRSRVEAGDALSLSEAHDLAGKLLSGLQALHAQGLVQGPLSLALLQSSGQLHSIGVLQARAWRQEDDLKALSGVLQRALGLESPDDDSLSSDWRSWLTDLGQGEGTAESAREAWSALSLESKVGPAAVFPDAPEPEQAKDGSYDWVNAPTIRTDSEPLQRLIEMDMAPELLSRVEGSPEKGLARAVLRVETVRGPVSLFVYGGRRLQMGRHSLERGDSDVCLRLRPHSEFAQESSYISGRHLKFEVADDTVTVTDLESRGGTTLNGFALKANMAEEMGPEALIRVADALDLQAFLLPRASMRELAFESADCVVSKDPALFVERPRNGQEHMYALIPGRLVLTLNEDASLRGGTGTTGCEAELFFAKGSLWLLGGGLPEGRCQALTDGFSFEIKGSPIHVHELRIEDQL